MLWWQKYFLLSPEPDNGGGGGAPAPKPDDKPDATKLLADIQAANAALLARIDKLEKDRGTKADPPDDDLARKAQLKREADEKSSSHTKDIEQALRFSLGAPDWLKTNAALLPKTIGGIFEQAGKENYGSETEKAAAIKVGIVSEFFAQQANLDLLTEAQKSQLEDFKKLTKTDKQERVKQIFENVFEPSFEMLKRVQKAQQVAKGHGDASDAETAYKNKMQAISRKHYLGEKNA